VRIVGLAGDEVIDPEQDRADQDEMQQRFARPFAEAGTRSGRGCSRNVRRRDYGSHGIRDAPGKSL
jgi:hypothetical protein